VRWQASSELEKEDILRAFFRDSNGLKHNDLESDDAAAPDISVAPNISVAPTAGQLPFAKPGHKILRISFLSRITNKKNLAYALKVLAEIQVDIAFDIYGPIDRDKDYWRKCQRLISRLPKNINTRYLGPVEASQVQKVFSEYDLFFFPTSGLRHLQETFGRL
jgi:glycosyltransferase involved in cell wall biosynthesis